MDFIDKIRSALRRRKMNKVLARVGGRVICPKCHIDATLNSMIMHASDVDKTMHLMCLGCNHIFNFCMKSKRVISRKVSWKDIS